MKVKKLPVDPGPAAWNEILPAPSPATELDERVTADWLVIGAGFAGLSAARRLAQLRPHDRIVVLEARRLAEGPAGRNSGFMIDLPHDLASEDYGGGIEADRTQTELNRLAIAFAKEAAAEYEMSPEALAPVGKTNAAATDKGMAHNHAYGAHLQAMNEAFEMLDARAMREMTGSNYYRGGLYTPGAVMLQPALYIRSLGEGLKAQAVRIAENSPVVSMTRQSGGWLATTPKGAVSAGRVILAVNGHVESFGYFERRLMHVFTYASMTRALSADEAAKLGGQPRWGVTPADPMGTTVRRIRGIGGDRLVVRNRFTYDPSMQIADARIGRIVRDHDRAFKARFPKLASVEMAYRWGGRLCLARNNVPAFGEVEEGMFTACCQNGLGTARGTLAGLSAAELATSTPSSGASELATASQPTRLPPEPLSWLGANAVIRWKEYRAGAEL